MCKMIDQVFEPSIISQMLRKRSHGYIFQESRFTSLTFSKPFQYAYQSTQFASVNAVFTKVKKSKNVTDKTLFVTLTVAPSRV